jgi:tRNA threonylcarbamoyladenosine biosynthesis protein TsaB
MPTERGPTLLAFELATEACSVALLHDGALIARHEVAPRRHVELALPWAEALLAEAGIAKSQLDALAVGVGPGAFTGVRLAISLVQGIALGLDRPVLPVSTLAALAAPFLAEGPVLAAIDARMGELYVGEFVRDADGLPHAVADELVLPLEAAAEVIATRGHEARVGVGTGFAAGGGVWFESIAGRFVRIDASALPTASAVARIAARDFFEGRAVAPERLEPTYLRDKVALTSAEQAAARAAKQR